MCFKLTSISPLQGQKVGYNLKTATEKGIDITFKFETDPVVPDIDCGLFALTEVKKETVDETKVDEYIDSIRKMYATREDITDRAVQLGDVIKVDIEDLDQDPSVKSFEDHPLLVSEKDTAKWFVSLVVGLNIGESNEGVSAPNDDETEDVKKEFEPKKVKVTVNSISKEILTPLDNDFAKKLGVDDVDTLKVRIKDQLEKKAEKNFIEDRRLKIGDQLIEKIKFEVPPSVMQREAVSRIKRQFFDNDQAKDEWTNLSEDEQKKHHERIIEEAKSALRLFYICHKIILDNKLEYSIEEDAQTPESFLEMMFMDPNQPNPKEMTDEEKSIAESRKMMDVAQDYIVSKVLDS